MNMNRACRLGFAEASLLFVTGAAPVLGRGGR